MKVTIHVRLSGDRARLAIGPASILHCGLLRDNFQGVPSSFTLGPSLAIHQNAGTMIANPLDDWLPENTRCSTDFCASAYRNFAGRLRTPTD